MRSWRAESLGWALMWLAAASLAPLQAQAGDGRIEISQTAVLAAGGFPYVISSPGSYLLTSDLTPPANVIGIEIDADGVNLDLNGFAIRGNLVCVPGSCTGAGPSAGVSVPASPLTNGRHCSVRNGSITGINGSAIDLRDEALVDAVFVSNTFYHAVILGPHSLATRNRITSVGRSGLLLGAGSGYGENVIAATGLFFAFGTVSGGKPVGGNVCDDGRCPGARRFYLTQALVNGSATLSACDAGFHMASRWELLDVSHLRYDRVRGFTRTDMGQGPPDRIGWMRTGYDATSGNVDPGLANCNGWQSADTTEFGTIGTLDGLWPPTGSSGELGWAFGRYACDYPTPVWCIEDD